MADTTAHQPAAPPAVAPRRGRPRKILLIQIALPIMFVVIWQLLGFVIDDFYLATPTAAFAALAQGVRDGWLGDHLGSTAAALAYGYGLAVGIGVVSGFLIGLSRFAYEVLEPIVMALYAVPKVMLYPIFLFIFGLSASSNAWLAMTFGVFPILVFTMNGTRQVAEVHMKVARSYRLGRIAMFRYVVFPSILPSIVTGLRLGFGVTFLGIVLAEMFASARGMGFVLVGSVELHNMPRMYGVILLLVILALAVNGAFMLWERALRGPSVSSTP